MIFDQDLPKFLWGEATVTTIYIQNRSLHRIVNNMTLKEAFTWKKPCVNHLWIFGCPTYIHVPKDKRKNLDSTSIKGIFVGYSLSSKAYRIYIKEGRQIEVSRDVIFDENHAYKRSKDIPIYSDDEDTPLFEEEKHRDEATPNQEEEYEGPRELILPMFIPKTRKMPNWLKATLEYAKGHESTKGTLQKEKDQKYIQDMQPTWKNW